MDNPKTYSSGKPCVRGHVAPRFRSTGNCTECGRERARKANQTPEQRARIKELFKPSPYAAQNWRDWYDRNPKVALARTRAQQIARQKRVPPWSEKEAIEAFYAACPEGYEVDHIIPLQGLFVSGLHVLSNLQYLPMLDNRRKGRSF